MLLKSFLTAGLLSLGQVGGVLSAVLDTERFHKHPCKNSPYNRQCWSDGFDINTNYYASTPNTGVVREYWLSVENSTISPDGTQVGGAITINGSIPGPTLYGDWGDTFKIHVTNNLENNGTSLHWHGIRQLNSNQQDGISGIVQCPTAPGTTTTYEWQATEYGSSWYHSHFTVQYGAGAQGPIQINGPATMNYDEDLGPMLLQDWVHSPSVFGALVGIADVGHRVNMSSGLINGTNVIPCDTSTSTCMESKHWETTVRKHKTYRLRIVNGAVQTFFRFMIDNHTFHVIANDFVPVHPYEASSIVLGEGQRYDIVFKADQKKGNYWLRALWQDCPNTYIVTANQTLGIVRYEGADSSALPTTTNKLTAPEYNTCGSDGFYETAKPYVPMTVGSPAQEQEIQLGLNKAHGLFTVNQSSFLIDWTDPTIAELDRTMGKGLPYYEDKSNATYTNKTLNNEGYDLPLPYDGAQLTSQNIVTLPAQNQWVYFYWNDYTGVGEYHPMHLHGHDFWVLHQAANEYWHPGDPLNLDNPPRRDTATLPANGTLVIGFYTDNPGAWLFHCHIAWHVSQGLSLQFLERPQEILDLYDMDALNQTCQAWDAWVQSPARITGQDDSGV